MKSIKKLGLVISGIAFCLSIFAVTSNAQYNNRRWENRRDTPSIYQSQRRQNRRASEWRRSQLKRHWQNRSRYYRYNRRENRYYNRGYNRSYNNNRNYNNRRYRRNW